MYHNERECFCSRELAPRFAQRTSQVSSASKALRPARTSNSYLAAVCLEEGDATSRRRTSPMSQPSEHLAVAARASGVAVEQVDLYTSTCIEANKTRQHQRKSAQHDKTGDLIRWQRDRDHPGTMKNAPYIVIMVAFVLIFFHSNSIICSNLQQFTVDLSADHGVYEMNAARLQGKQLRPFNFSQVFNNTSRQGESTDHPACGVESHRGNVRMAGEGYCTSQVRRMRRRPGLGRDGQQLHVVVQT